MVEFLLACTLLLVAGCSAIAGIFSAGIWTAFFTIGAVVVLVFILTHGTKSGQ